MSTNVLATTIAQMPAVRHSDAEACNILFRQLQKDFPLYSVILAAATPDGTCLLHPSHSNRAASVLQIENTSRMRLRPSTFRLGNT